jgi:hypothetical protein
MAYCTSAPWISLESCTVHHRSQSLIWLSASVPSLKQLHMPREDLARARVLLQDEGFMHGDLTNDKQSVWVGRFFHLNHHIIRLSGCHCDNTRLKLPFSSV